MRSGSGAGAATAILVFGIMACLVVGLGAATIGPAFSDQADKARVQSAAREAEAEAAEAEAEAQRALAEAAQTEQEAREAEARAREAEAEAERLRAEGARAESLADAYATRRLADEAARSIRRQGRLLALSQLQVLVMGVVLGVAIVVIAALVWALRAQGGNDDK